MTYSEFIQEAEQHPKLFERSGLTGGYIPVWIYGEEIDGRFTMWVQEGTMCYKCTYPWGEYETFGHAIMNDENLKEFNTYGNKYYALTHCVISCSEVYTKED